MNKMVGILTFITRTNNIVCFSEKENHLICLYFDSYEDCKDNAKVCWAYTMFWNLRAT